MKAYILTEFDFENLLKAIDRDPAHGINGGSSVALTDEQRTAHDEAHRFYSHQVRVWIEGVQNRPGLRF